MKVSPFILAGAGIVFATSVHAGLENISYPVTELGGCENQDACFAYCSEPANYDACMTFAETNQILEEEEIQEYRDVQELIAQGGPGGCTSEATCKAYCDDIINLEECLSFASENGMMSEEELAEARQVLTALQSGASLPGGCTSQESCDAYCGDMTHIEECLAFGKAAGLMSEEELAEAEQMLTILQTTGTPGGCVSKESCDAYCADEANVEECVSFAVEAGFMTSEEAEQVRERGGVSREEFVGPGGCTGEEACKAYCEQEEHREECGLFFGEQVDPFSREMRNDVGDSAGTTEYEQYDPSSFVGPGGCTGEDACKAFCAQEVNRDTCAAFFGGDMGGQDESQPSYEAPSYEDPSYEESGSYNQDYQLEGGESYEMYKDEGYRENFESLNPEEFQLDVRSEEPEQPHEEIYVEPPSQEGEPMSASGLDAGFVESTRQFLKGVLADWL
ncbi:hypothetical protein HY630_01310 [Candidatus Uhrbacteria bacterium]|nr:hypothetical protein [Candidatus Uhrbacteria bacterium]